MLTVTGPLVVSLHTVARMVVETMCFTRSNPGILGSKHIIIGLNTKFSKNHLKFLHPAELVTHLFQI